MSSYLGELKRICWALEETRALMKGRILIVWTDLESAFERIKRRDVYPKCMYDVRVARFLSCLWSNFIEERLEMKFIPGEYNGIANI